jgi:AcrR family transcriptional regulator
MGHARCRTTRGKLRTYFRTKDPDAAVQRGQALMAQFLDSNHQVLERYLGKRPTADDVEHGVRAFTGFPEPSHMLFQVGLSVEPQVRLFAVCEMVSRRNLKTV